MGGISEMKIRGLRFHVSAGNVHAHDDSKNLKFECPTNTFKTEVNDALARLTTDGIVPIASNLETGSDLCIVRDGNKYFMFLRDDLSIKPDLEIFIKGI